MSPWVSVGQTWSRFREGEYNRSGVLIYVSYAGGQHATLMIGDLLGDVDEPGCGCCGSTMSNYTIVVAMLDLRPTIEAAGVPLPEDGAW